MSVIVYLTFLLVNVVSLSLCRKSLYNRIDVLASANRFHRGNTRYFMMLFIEISTNLRKIYFCIILNAVLILYNLFGVIICLL